MTKRSGPKRLGRLAAQAALAIRLRDRRYTEAVQLAVGKARSRRLLARRAQLDVGRARAKARRHKAHKTAHESRRRNRDQ